MSDKPTVTKEAVEDVLTSIASRCDAELYAKTREELEEYWFFTYDPGKTVALNLYHFHDMLRLYGGFCCRWEEHHCGVYCVVKRVRDKFLMPKIEAFAERIKGLS